MSTRSMRIAILLVILVALLGLTTQPNVLAHSVKTTDQNNVLQRGEGAKVALVIVDDFTGIDLSAVRDTYNEDATCVVDLEGQGYAVRGASGTELEDVPHGEVVLAQVEELLAQAGLTDTIQVVQVDLGGINSDAVIAGIEAELAKLTDIDFFVINMSFVMIPCEHVREMAEIGSNLRNIDPRRDAQTYRASFDQARAIMDTQVRQRFEADYQMDTDTMSDTAAEVVEYSNPVIEFLDTAGANKIFIASAGNFGLDYSFLPGAYPQVVSVSASNGFGYEASAPWNPTNNNPLLSLDPATRAGAGTRISNYGEVMLPGEYTHPEYGTIIGTSFAAPRLSVAVAAYLATVGGDYCQANGNFALAYGTDDNLTLSQAISQHCATMADSVPTN